MLHFVQHRTQYVSFHALKPFPPLLPTACCSCCSRDAEGQETRVTIDIAGESFTATGLMVTEVRGFWDWDVSTGWRQDACELLRLCGGAVVAGAGL